MFRTLLASLAVVLFALPAPAQNSGVASDWREPGGSVIRIAPCGAELCARLVALSSQAPGRADVHNPDPAKRIRPLCGLQIGYGFQPSGPDHAEGGHLYDPKSGKTYQGEMTARGDHLMLRGYVGIKLFGRTEEWTRIPPWHGACGQG